MVDTSAASDESNCGAIYTMGKFDFGTMSLRGLGTILLRKSGTYVSPNFKTSRMGQAQVLLFREEQLQAVEFALNIPVVR
jgi:hypothetical protein